MSGISKDKWADLWAMVKPLRTKELEGLHKRIGNELAARAEAKNGKPDATQQG